MTLMGVKKSLSEISAAEKIARCDHATPAALSAKEGARNCIYRVISGFRGFVGLGMVKNGLR
jgi:hypothetical protein